MTEAVSIYNIPNWLAVENKPSIFEIIAQENFSTSLKSGLKYLVQVFTNNYPDKCFKLNQHFDEIYLLFDLIVQALHLYQHEASFGESFFNFKRSLVNSSQVKLPPSKLISSFVFLVFTPYTKDKLNSIYKKLETIHYEKQRQLTWMEIKFVQTYPYILTSFEIFALFFKLSYTVGNRSTHSPILHYLGLSLTRDNFNKSLDKNKSSGTLSRLAGWLVNAFKYNLTVTAYLIQFLDYWYSRESRRIKISSLVIPPVPRKYTNTQSSKTCPICNRKRKNDAILKTSGFVFCQECIFNFVENNGRCPVTGYHSIVNHIVPLYIPEH